MKDRDLSVRNQIQSGVSSITVWNLGEPSDLGILADIRRPSRAGRFRRNLDETLILILDFDEVW